jgi:hypothetical protein
MWREPFIKSPLYALLNERDIMEGKKDEEKLYHAMLKGMIKQLEQKNIEIIQADLEGYKQPEFIEKNRPDIIGKNKEGKTVIVKIETGTTINSEKTKEKFKEFSQTDGEFWVEVPESRSREIAEKIKEWKISIDKWFIGQDI